MSSFNSELQSDKRLAELVFLLDFYSSFKEESFPNWRRFSLDPPTYVMKFNTSRYRSSLSDNPLCAALRVSTSDIQPEFSALNQISLIEQQK